MRGRTWVKSKVTEQAWVRMYRADALCEQGGKCAYCRAPIRARAATADHVVARRHGGTTRKENIKAACLECNKTKGSQSASAFLNLIKHPAAGAHIEVWMAWSRRRMFLATERACTRINRAAQ